MSTRINSCNTKNCLLAQDARRSAAGRLAIICGRRPFEAAEKSRAVSKSACQGIGNLKFEISDGRNSKGRCKHKYECKCGYRAPKGGSGRQRWRFFRRPGGCYEAMRYVRFIVATGQM